MKKQLITTSVIAAAFILSACTTLQENAASQKITTPDGVTLMNEMELRETLVGNTYEGNSVKYDGSYIEYIHPDGNIRGLWNGIDRYKGKWAISGQVWCYKYRNSSGCNTLSKKGNTIYWYKPDGSTRGGKATVLTGDPKKLSQ